MGGDGSHVRHDDTPVLKPGPLVLTAQTVVQMLRDKDDEQFDLFYEWFINTYYAR